MHPVDILAVEHPLRADEIHLGETDERAVLTDGSGRAVARIDRLGATIWKRLDGRTDLGSIANGLVRSMQLDEEESFDHLVAFIDELEGRGLVIRTPITAAPRAPVDTSGLTFDFIMKPHPMAADPVGRPTSLDLLSAVAERGTPDGDAWSRIVTSLRSTLGPNRSVWGVKLEGGELSYELYFCTHSHPPTDQLQPYFEDVVRGFEQVAEWNAPRDLPPSAGMVSFEFEIDGRSRVHGPTTIDTYQRSDPTSEVWVSYRLGDGSHELRNTYQSHELPDDEAGLAKWFAQSRFTSGSDPTGGAGYWLARIHELRACAGTWCARKPSADGIYLRRVHPVDLAHFLADRGYPDRIRDFVDAHVDRLDHLRFECSFDFRVEDGEVVVHKSGFYGYF